MSESRFRVRKDIVEKACRAAIDDVNGRRRKFFNTAVERTMRKRWYRGSLDRDEAERRVSCWSSDTADWRAVGWGTLYDAERLLGACGVADGDTVELGTDDAVFVGQWTERKD